MPWTVRKSPHGWWYVSEVVSPFGTDLSLATEKARSLNAERRKGKRQNYLMARREFEQAEKTFPEDPAMQRLAERLS